MIEEYTSRHLGNGINFPFIAYHTTKSYLVGDIFNYGGLDPKAEHKGECPYDVVWFTISDDYDGPFRFTYEIDENTFDEKGFRWMNDAHLVTSQKIDLFDKRLRIDKINGVKVDNIYNMCNDGTRNGLDKFFDKMFELTDYELSSEDFVMKLIQQYGLKRSDYFMDDESQEMDESENGVIYYGVFLDNESRDRLMELLPDDCFKVFCDHMTVAFKTSFTPDVVRYCESREGDNVGMIATHIGLSDDVMAVRVDTDCKSTNVNKHITLCTLRPGAKPVQSNDITDWRPLETPMHLNGVFRSYPFRISENTKHCGMCENYINEVEAGDISLKSFEPKDELNPNFWIDGKINSRVRLKLLDLADEYIDGLSVDWVKPEDIVLTGSIANYNWSKYSDVDVHILMDYKKVWNKTEFVKDYFDSKKQQWNEEHKGLKIYGFPVEIYVEDVNQDNPSSGIYSLNTNEWLVEPHDFQDAEINEDFIKKQSAKLMTEIDDAYDRLSKEKDSKKLETLSTKMKNMFDKLAKQRKESLEKHGEMGTYNIIWKVLRRSGHLDKLWEIIHTVYDKINTIK